jgi:hypothetical protein
MSLDFLLPFFTGNTDKFAECGIDTTGLRHSLDGTQAIIHMQNLTIEQFNEVRTKTSILALTHEQTQELMASAEWSIAE